MNFPVMLASLKVAAEIFEELAVGKKIIVSVSLPIFAIIFSKASYHWEYCLLAFVAIRRISWHKAC